MEELKECPFCGGEAELGKPMIGTADKVYWVECLKCGTDGPMFDTNQNDAIEAWNRRDGEVDSKEQTAACADSQED